MLEVVLSSSRRVKKGPGRRPQSAKRQRFVELRERGWSILAAAREVGVSRTTGNNWSRGYKTYRHGQIVGFVAALERLAVRQISPRFLSQDERIEIADLRHAGLSIRQIAHRQQRRTEAVGRGASGSTVEPTADQSSLAPEVPRAIGDVAVSREHLPGCLSAGMGTAAAISAGSAPPLTAAHRARSSARSSTG